MVRKRIDLLTFLVFAHLFFSPFAFADFLQDDTLRLVREGGKGVLEFEYSSKISEDFFDGDGNRKSTIATSAPTRFSEQDLTINFDYGVTDKFTLSISLPFRHRREKKRLNASNFGLGDIELGARYQLTEFFKNSTQLVASVVGRFPSGSADVDGLGSNQTSSNSLPLGTGQVDTIFALQLRSELVSEMYLRTEVGYNFRVPATVAYARDGFSYLDPETGDTQNFIVGNRRVNFGDELHFRLEIAKRIFERFTFRTLGFLRMFRSGELDNFNIDVNSDGNANFTFDDFNRTTYNLEPGYEVQLQPGIDFSISSSLSLHSTVIFPLLGKNVPSSPPPFNPFTFSLVDGLVGNEYRLSVRYAF